MEQRPAEDGFDEEDIGAEKPGNKAWDPAKIRVYTKSFSLRQVIDEIEDGNIDLAPDFQRGIVWQERQKTRLIESILVGIPLPAFYFDCNSQSRFKVVDGIHRLSTISLFAAGKFSLSADLEYLKDLVGKNFQDLAPPLRRRLHQSQIVVHVIEPTSPLLLKYDIFKRINTGGSPLSPQEIRHCMSQPRTRSFLKQLTDLPSFRAATGIKDCLRMQDLEMVLRYVAFSLLCEKESEIETFPADSLDAFLTQTSERLGFTEEIPDEKLTLLTASLDIAMKNADKIFGAHAFRRSEGEKKNRLNKALFDCWSVGLARIGRELTDAEATKLRSLAAAALKEDAQYQEAISCATGMPEKIRDRFQITFRLISMLDGVGNDL